MKKALVLLLALALLIPMVPANALVQPANAPVTAEPFYALGWSDFDEKTYPFLEGLHTTSFTNVGENAKLGNMIYGQYSDKEVTEVAQSIKAEMDRRPAGTRYWHMFGPSTILKLAPENVLFLEHGIVQLRDMFTAVINKLKQLGCPLDGVVIDTEIVFMGAWYIYADNQHSVDHYYNKNKNIYAQIVKNPKYKTMIRPLLEAYGFPFWPNPSGYKSEIFSICYENKGAQYDLARNIWNTVMRIHINNYANQWCYEPLKAAYPNASLSDYQSHDSKSWMKLAAITDDGAALSGGNSVKVGTASSFSYYYARPGSDFFNAHSQYASFNDAEYEASAFNALLYDVNFTRHMLSSTDTKQIAPWITSYLYGAKKPASMAQTPYYTELLYHLGMFDPEPFLSYTYLEDYKEEGEKASYTSPKYLATQQTMNEIMAELTRVAGYSDRKPIELPQYWNAEYVVSGMYANGRNIWRITPNTDEISLDTFKVKNADPTFSVKGQTISFPKGKILDSATISNVGSCGYWVETPKGVTPVMTADANRYAKYPSFEENFDSYANGALSTENMQTAYAWKSEVGAGSSANISGKALVLTGDVRFQNVTIPAKITAGDSFAKNQTWEMTFTVPSGLADKAELQLLKYESANTRLLDGGIKIQGGKAYYSDIVAGVMEYQEFAEIKPGTYTVKRVLNFSDPNSFTYSVYLLDAKGKEIANAKHAQSPTFTAITGISFLTKSANKAILVDNYKLYPSGLATDFELYDGAAGINLKGDDAVNIRDKSTAYRLSWLNGSDFQRTVTVVAAFYEGNNLKSEKAIQVVTMNPGCDGVETGVVELKAGQRVRVSLKEGVHQDVEYTEPGATESESLPLATQATTVSQAATDATKPKTSKATKATKPKSTKSTKATASSDATGSTQATAPFVKTEIFEGGIKEINASLKKAGLDTVEKVKDALVQNILLANQKIPAENIVHYDVTADKDDIPKDGKMTVVLPYPAGTDDTYKFFVAHMFTSDKYGKKPGDVEMPEVTNTADGIQFQVTGLSPISVGWIAPDPAATDAATETTAPAHTQAGKSNVLLIVSVVVAVLAVAGGATWFFLKKKKPAEAAETTEETEETEEIEELDNDPEA